MGRSVGGVARIKLRSLGQATSAGRVHPNLLITFAESDDGGSMALGRPNSFCLVVAIAMLTVCCCAQNQDSTATTNSKWLRCDVDWMFTPYDVGSDFSMRFSFRQSPLRGIRIELNPTEGSANSDGSGTRTVTAVTDSSGTAHFLSVPAGVYTAGAKDGLFFPSNEITVHADGDFDSEITMEWPLEPIPIRVLRGKLTTSTAGNKTNHPLRAATVELVGVYSSKVIEQQHIRADGSYEFSTVEPGLYALRVTPPYQNRRKEPQSGELAIELDLAARKSTIPDINVVQSDYNGVQLFHED